MHLIEHFLPFAVLAGLVDVLYFSLCALDPFFEGLYFHFLLFYLGD
jgi:hypothetical protein